MAEALLALAQGDPEGAASRLSSVVARDRTLGNDYSAACLDLELASALDAAGAASDAAEARARARSVLDPLGCINPF